MIMELADPIDDQCRRSDLQLSGRVIMKRGSDLGFSGSMINTGEYMIDSGRDRKLIMEPELTGNVQVRDFRSPKVTGTLRKLD
jgi:hypothetical protein